jgi:hypothetical protein
MLDQLITQLRDTFIKLKMRDETLEEVLEAMNKKNSQTIPKNNNCGFSNPRLTFLISAFVDASQIDHSITISDTPKSPERPRCPLSYSRIDFDQKLHHELLFIGLLEPGDPVYMKMVPEAVGPRTSSVTPDVFRFFRQDTEALPPLNRMLNIIDWEIQQRYIYQPVPFGNVYPDYQQNSDDDLPLPDPPSNEDDSEIEPDPPLLRETEFDCEFPPDQETNFVNILAPNNEWLQDRVQLDVTAGEPDVTNLTADLRQFHRRYLRYDTEADLIESIFAIFETPIGTNCHTITAICQKTLMPERTLRNWKIKFDCDPSWRPGSKPQANNARHLTDDEEDKIKTKVIEDYISREVVLTMGGLRQIILQAHRTSHPNPNPRKSFTCTRCFLAGFMKRNGLSYRKNRTARRPAIRAEEVTSMFARIREISPENEDRLVNIDESFWLVLQPPKKTICFKGVESVHTMIEGDPKAGFTFIGAITKSGRKLPLYIIAKGKTHVCHKQFGGPQDHPNHIEDVDFRIDHSETGWVTQCVFNNYLRWLKTLLPPGESLVLLDQYPTHFSSRTMAVAASIEGGMELIPVPKGGTGAYQPLDRRIFGNLKAKGAASWGAEYLRDPLEMAVASKPIALRLLLETWDQISPEHITDAWSIFTVQPTGEQV